MIWEQLIQLALLGTERSNLNPKLRQALEEAGINTRQEITKVLIEAITYFGPLQKAGWQPQAWTEKRLEASPPEINAVCSPKSAGHLKKILRSYPQLLPEYVNNLLTHNKCLPPETLPALFDKCIKDETLWLHLKGCIGERGKWLLPLNREWKTLQTPSSTAGWKLGTKAERVAILKHLRSTKANKGLSLLRTTWEKDGLSEKTSLLKCLQIGLSLADEAFLEDCLDFKRKEIRLLASNFLAQLPKSQLQQRLQAALANLISVDKKTDTFVVDLPNSDDKNLIRDGINPKQKGGSANPKVNMLVQMIQVVPPTFWEKHLVSSPIQIIQLFAESDSSMLLTNALVASTVLHKTENWMAAFLGFWLTQFHTKAGQSLKMEALLKKLPNPLFNQLLYQKLKAAQHLPSEQSPILRLLLLDNQKWDKRIAILFMTQLRDWIAKNSTFSYTGPLYRTILKDKAAYAIDPLLHPEISTFWYKEQRNWAGWETDIQVFLNILSFRREIA